MPGIRVGQSFPSVLTSGKGTLLNNLIENISVVWTASELGLFHTSLSKKLYMSLAGVGFSFFLLDP